MSTVASRMIARGREPLSALEPLIAPWFAARDHASASGSVWPGPASADPLTDGDCMTVGSPPGLSGPAMAGPGNSGRRAFRPAPGEDRGGPPGYQETPAAAGVAPDADSHPALPGARPSRSSVSSGAWATPAPDEQDGPGQDLPVLDPRVPGHGDVARLGTAHVPGRPGRNGSTARPGSMAGEPGAEEPGARGRPEELWPQAEQTERAEQAERAGLTERTDRTGQAPAAGYPAGGQWQAAARADAAPVTISIGHIEVRAAPDPRAAQPPSRPDPAPRPPFRPRLTLADFLDEGSQRRGNGSR